MEWLVILLALFAFFAFFAFSGTESEALFEPEYRPMACDRLPDDFNVDPNDGWCTDDGIQMTRISQYVNCRNHQDNCGAVPTG